MDNRTYICTNQTLVSPERILNKTNIESERVEFLPHWNPKIVFPSIVAFANDLHNRGGGYIVVGVESDLQGNALLPAKGLSQMEIEAIRKNFEQYRSFIYPQYHPQVSFAQVSGKTILVIWAPTGEERPYSIIDNPQAPLSKRQAKSYFKIRQQTKDATEMDVCMFLNDMGISTPFDNRTNPDIKISDISPILVKEYLSKTQSPLLKLIDKTPFIQVLDRLGLIGQNPSFESSSFPETSSLSESSSLSETTSGADSSYSFNSSDALSSSDPLISSDLLNPSVLGANEEAPQLKNVAAILFCPNPEKFFENMYVRVKDYRRSNTIQRTKYTEKIFRGPLITLIPNLMEFFSTLVIEENVIRQPLNLQQLKFFNYPIEAVTEGVVNALYHNDYQSGKPIEIVIDAFGISILNPGGPDKSIPQQNVQQCRQMEALSERNCRLGDFLKQLGWTSLAFTGMPNLQKQLCLNGNPAATVQTNPSGDYFCLTIPAHPFTKNAKLN